MNVICRDCLLGETVREQKRDREAVGEQEGVRG